MKDKIRVISLSALVLCLFIIIMKVFVELYIQGIVMKNLRVLNFYEADVVTQYFHQNYISLLKIDTIGLTIALLTACVLIGIAFYLKITYDKTLYKKIFISIFTTLNMVCVISAIMTLFSEEKMNYLIVQISVISILSMIAIDSLYTFIKKEKSLTKILKTACTITASVLLVFGINIHCNDINRIMDSNEEIIAYRYEKAEEYFYNLYEDEQYAEILIEEYMLVYLELHSNKGLLIGSNSVTKSTYEFIIDNDGISPFYTPLTQAESEMYQKYNEEMTFNIPLLASLFIALLAVLFTTISEENEEANIKENIEMTLAKFQLYQNKLQSNEITQEEYEKYRSILFENY